MLITMKEIAEIAGVDTSTVSRALNNDTSISSAQRDIIADIANKYNYKKRKINHKTILFIINKKLFLLTSRFFNRVIEGIEGEIKSRGYTFQLNPLDHESCLLDDINIKNITGMIVTGGYHDDFILKIKKTGIPMVLLDCYLPTEDISVVLIDNVDGIMKGVEYLSSLGHKRIAYLKGDTVGDIGSKDRLIGYKRGVEKYGLDNDKDLVLDCDFSIRGAYEAMKTFLNTHNNYPSAVMAVNDIVAMGAMEAIKEKRLAIPGDISVLGFDDIDLADEIIPRLSTMHVRKRTIGRLAVQRLFKIINKQKTDYHKIIVKPKLIIRESTGKAKIRSEK